MVTLQLPTSPLDFPSAGLCERPPERRPPECCICRLIPQSGVPGFGAELPVFVAGMSLGGCIALHSLLSSVGPLTDRGQLHNDVEQCSELH